MNTVLRQGILTLFVLGLSSAAARTAHAPTQEQHGPVIRFVKNPDAAPAFELKDIAGERLSLEGAKGKVVLLNFWATWCGPCRAEIPDLIELQEKYKDQLLIIGLIVDDDDPDSIRKFVEKSGINYRVALASTEIRQNYGGIPALPTSFVLDAQGRVVQKHVGLNDPALYEVEIRALLGLPVAARVEAFEDTGQVFLAHADRASELPGVDLGKLTAEQKAAVLRRFNAETCNCGCALTLAQCRINDSNCRVSRERTAKIISGILASPAKSPAGADSTAPVPRQN